MATVRSASFSAGGGGAGGATPRTATMFACVTTLSNTLLGVSVVGVAGGFARAGWLVSCLPAVRSLFESESLVLVLRQ